MKKTTWKDVDNIIKMKKSGVDFSLVHIEVYLAENNISELREIVLGLKGVSEVYSADVYPFIGTTIAETTIIERFKRNYKEDTLIESLYNKCKKEKFRVKEREKIKRLAEEAEKREKALKEKEKELKKKEKELEEKKELARKVTKGYIKEHDKDPDVSVKEVGSSIPKKPEKPKKPKKPSIPIRDQIKFDIIKSNETLDAFIPREDKLYEYPEWTLQFVSMLDHGMNVWLYGGTGSGKSSLVEQVCSAGSLPIMYQSFHEDIKPDSLFGGFRLEDGNTIWHDGPVTKAYRDGLVLLLDEIDSTPPEILFCLFAVLDRKPLVLADNACEVIHPHPNFRVVATGNTLGRGDDTGSYSGTNVLNRAFLNRFRVWYSVDYPSEDVYADVMKNEGVSEEVARMIANFAHKINNESKNGTITETFSLRDAREVGKIAEIIGKDNIEEAISIGFMNRLSPIEKASVESFFKDCSR